VKCGTALTGVGTKSHVSGCERCWWCRWGVVLGLGSGNVTFSGAGLAVVAGVGTDEGSTATACAAVGCAAAAGGVGRIAAANGCAGLAASTVADAGWLFLLLLVYEGGAMQVHA
jgi:hypothetical protein